MNTTTTTYRDEFFHQCVNLMSDTWNHDMLFPGLNRANLIKEPFFEEATAGANYSEVILDGHGAVQGYLFGISNKNPLSGVGFAIRAVRLFARILYHYLSGHFGPLRAAWRRATDLPALVNSLEAQKRSSDG